MEMEDDRPTISWRRKEDLGAFKGTQHNLNLWQIDLKSEMFNESFLRFLLREIKPIEIEHLHILPS